MTAQTITIERVIDAPIERVFDAWITPADLVKWHHAGDDWTTPYAEVDARVGGVYKIGYQNPEGEVVFDLVGRYTEVTRPTRLAYTIADVRDVTVDFEDLGGKTKITLVFDMEHENSEELQRRGWTEHVVNLESYLLSQNQ